jgi:hypothetical protein
MPNEQFSYTSSSLVKQVAMFGGDVSHFVPADVGAALKAAFGGASVAPGKRRRRGETMGRSAGTAL